MTEPSSFFADPSKFRTSPSEFCCGEALEEGGGIIGKSGVLFFCTFPTAPTHTTKSDDVDSSCHNNRLTFHCRDRSCGVLEKQESAVTNDEFEETQNAFAVDPFFFEKGYTLAGRTGFQVWSGTRFLIESLLFPLVDDSDRLVAIQENFNSTETKKHVLELGAGVGCAGTILAAATGSQVLLTDLPTLVENSLLPNLKRNESRAEITRGETSLIEPPWLLKASYNLEFVEEESENVVFPIGNMGGWASIAAIDWTQPLNKQVSSISSLDWIIASDCVWLVSMLESLFDTVHTLFSLNPNARLLLSFQRRDGIDSTQFSSVTSIVNSVKKREWSLDCLAWRYVNQEGEDEPKEVFLFEIASEGLK